MPVVSIAETVASTGVVYQPFVPFGAAGVSVVVVTGASVSTNGAQVNARGVMISDQPCSDPVSPENASATWTCQVPLVRVPLCRPSWPTGSGA